MSSDLRKFMENFDIQLESRYSKNRYYRNVEQICQSFQWYVFTNDNTPIYSLLNQIIQLGKSCRSNDPSLEYLDRLLTKFKCDYLLHFLHGDPNNFNFVKSLEKFLNRDYKTITDSGLFTFTTILKSSPDFYAIVTNKYIQKIKDLSIAYIMSLIFIMAKKIYSIRDIYRPNYIRSYTASPDVKNFFIEHIKNNTSFITLLSSNMTDVKKLKHFSTNNTVFIKIVRFCYNNTLQIIKKINDNVLDPNNQNYKLYFGDVIVNNEINYTNLINKTFDADIYHIVPFLSDKQNNINDPKLNIELNIKQFDPNMTLVIDV